MRRCERRSSVRVCTSQQRRSRDRRHAPPRVPRPPGNPTPGRSADKRDHPPDHVGRNRRNGFGSPGHPSSSTRSSGAHKPPRMGADRPSPQNSRRWSATYAGQGRPSWRASRADRRALRERLTRSPKLRFQIRHRRDFPGTQRRHASPSAGVNPSLNDTAKLNTRPAARRPVYDTLAASQRDQTPTKSDVFARQFVTRTILLDDRGGRIEGRR